MDSQISVVSGCCALMGAGRSIAVQNFNANLNIFAMLGLYALMEVLELHIYFIITVFGLLLSGIMAALYKKTRPRPVSAETPQATGKKTRQAHAV